MADFKRFTGFIAPDGTTHDTLAKVKQHVLRLKIDEAAEKFAKSVFLDAQASAAGGTMGLGFSDMDNRAMPNPGITGPDDLREFLLAHQDAIKAIFAQSVRERAASKKKAAPVATPA
jgi:hypothetical protein